MTDQIKSDISRCTDREVFEQKKLDPTESFIYCITLEYPQCCQKNTETSMYFFFPFFSTITRQTIHYAHLAQTQVNM